MIYLYTTLILLVFLIFFSFFSIVDAKVFYVQSLFWVFGVIGILSVYYLEIKEVYIIEQFRSSHFNGATIVVLIMLVLHLFGVLFSLSCGKKIKNDGTIEFASTNENRLSNLSERAVFIVCASILFLVYLNLHISATPPLLQSGYVDRFLYLENTTLWSLIKPFGVIAVPIPIFIGWLFHRIKKKIYVFVLALLYVFYLALIGQKFGGFVLALFLFLLPSVVGRENSTSIVLLLKERWKIVFFVLGGAFLFVYYHYSKYPLADDFGGPLGLIFYRIFALQGHCFWGVFEHFSAAPFSFLDLNGLYDGMENSMILISPSIAEQMIDRGVRFTFGYFGSLLIHLNFFSFFAVFLFGILHGKLTLIIINCVKKNNPVKYFLYTNIFISFHSFISMGSMSYLYNYKVMLLVVLLLLIRSAENISSYFKKDNKYVCI